MLAIIFSSVFIAASYVSAEIPSYIHVCGRKNPNFDKCITNSIINLRENICNGIPELEAPSIESIIINSITVFDEDNAKIHLRDIKIKGLCDFIIKSFHIDLDKLHFDTSVTIKQANLNGTYDFDIHILVPFVRKGPIFLTAENTTVTIGVDLKTINRGNKKYIYMSKINLKLDIPKLSIKFAEGDKNTKLNEILKSLLNSTKEELIDKVKPTLEKEISNYILTISNNIIKHFTYDELFPDKM